MIWPVKSAWLALHVLIREADRMQAEIDDLKAKLNERETK
jgi:hypothetical protein